ncbi:MAG TPA: hypothetical protein VFD94_09375 [Jatrophihabitans sp.]|nr:hypothetical protein [Jatrophihabitans sp.]
MIGRGTGRHRPVRPSPAGCPRWLRRALLVGTAGAGLWLAGSLGHAGSAEASPLPPTPGGLARVAQQLPSLAADRTIAGPHSPAGSLLGTAPATLRSAGGPALTGLVPAAVDTATG